MINYINFIEHHFVTLFHHCLCLYFIIVSSCLLILHILTKIKLNL